MALPSQRISTLPGAKSLPVMDTLAPGLPDCGLASQLWLGLGSGFSGCSWRRPPPSVDPEPLAGRGPGRVAGLHGMLAGFRRRRHDNRRAEASLVPGLRFL